MPDFHLTPEYMFDGSVSPGVCWICNAARRRDLDEKIVDIHKSIDWEGWVQICGSCVSEMGALIGLIDAEQADTLKRQATSATESRDLSDKRANAAEKALES